MVAFSSWLFKTFLSTCNVCVLIGERAYVFLHRARTFGNGNTKNSLAQMTVCLGLYTYLTNFPVHDIWAIMTRHLTLLQTIPLFTVYGLPLSTLVPIKEQDGCIICFNVSWYMIRIYLDLISVISANMATWSVKHIHKLCSVPWYSTWNTSKTSPPAACSLKPGNVAVTLFSKEINHIMLSKVLI